MKYEMIKPIGHGAYGVVISALDHEANSKVIPFFVFCANKNSRWR